MKMYIPFGDWSDDGHGKYERVLVEAPSMESLLEAQKRIRAKYGDKFFEDYADQYEEPYLSDAIWQALIDTGYPADRALEMIGVSEWIEYKSLQEILAVDPCPGVCLDFVVDSFIWLLNAFGGEVKQLDKKDDIPMICNWTCHGFETVGYGCFW